MSKEEKTLKTMKKFFFIFGVCGIGGGSATLFVGGQTASVPTALLGMISLAIGAGGIYAAGLFKGKEREETLRFEGNPFESWRMPDCKSEERKKGGKHKNRFSL